MWHACAQQATSLPMHDVLILSWRNEPHAQIGCNSSSVRDGRKADWKTPQANGQSLKILIVSCVSAMDGLFPNRVLQSRSPK
mmetsp:Transcript_15448/g.27100  ORF Transcript_15448/g.27100 Transcript_15448/m.27100 type:complete len:82 (+) Transcript_15448:237-482(+)